MNWDEKTNPFKLNWPSKAAENGPTIQRPILALVVTRSLPLLIASIIAGIAARFSVGIARGKKRPWQTLKILKGFVMGVIQRFNRVNDTLKRRPSLRLQIRKTDVSIFLELGSF